MQWTTVAEAEKIEDLKLLVSDQDLPKGTPLRAVMRLKEPLAKLFDLPGAELAFKRAMPEGVILKDVHSQGSSVVVVEMEVDPPVLLGGVIGFIAANWAKLSLAAIGIMTALGFLILSIKVDAPAELVKGIALGIWGLVALVGLYLLTRKKKGG